MEKEDGSISLSVKVSRFDEGKFREREYGISLNKRATVLDALLNIKDKVDPTLSIRYSCRMGICGSCAMVIDGKPRLACETHINPDADSVRVEPMRGHPLLKDLVTDFDDFFARLRSVKPWIIQKALKSTRVTSRVMQDPENTNQIVPFSSCISCGLCVDACPVVNTHPNFIGPQALAQVHRFSIDSRDGEGTGRIAPVDSKEGIWGCEFVGACSLVCPKGVDPALAIQELKIEAMKQKMLRLISKGKK
ncbi:MAG: succinate dehydrogenase/fumarate reductase iron-sulfur subunit [Candidatus Micrarchaeota archaeon]|nr:succinate dehydrogenase/fumarate reductase iron-sulfur subunit [Candidatus Micrarchaeota archaeon]MDE1847985.1 succinate dehydrogenase/fumarate reductase iron-sulfur subunit [Candidatus Micrarchaeota archaeon]MDE1864672.1 succinate dehydrogenase/fumarate reductase iron-sulfur subunit [Candidatus Micrarchaeota archaeon]